MSRLYYNAVSGEAFREESPLVPFDLEKGGRVWVRASHIARIDEPPDEPRARVMLHDGQFFMVTPQSLYAVLGQPGDAGDDQVDQVVESAVYEEPPTPKSKKSRNA